VSAAYNHEFIEDSYVKGSVAVFTGVSNNNADSGDPYEICIYDNTGTELTCDTGTVPSLNVLFGHSYNIPLTTSITSLTANLTVNSGLEAEDTTTVVTANNGTLVLSNITYSADPHVGKVESVRFAVIDYLGNKVTNAVCSILSSDSSDLTPIDGIFNGVHSYDGFGAFSKLLITQAYSEDKNYIVEIGCTCSDGVDRNCFTNGSANIGNQIGRISTLFYIHPWLENVNTVTNKSYYTLDDDYITVCANVTNNHTFRIPLDIVYNFRCGTSDSATDRVVIDSLEESRGISGETTQNQCAELKIINKMSIAGKNNSCYAATEVHVLDELDEKIYTYSTTSSEFYLYSDIAAVEEEGGNFMDALVIFLVIIGYALGLIYCSYQIFYQKETVVPKGRLWEKVMLYFIGFTVLSCLPLYGYYVSLSSQFTAITPFLMTLSIIAFLVYFIGISYYVIHVLETTARLNEDED